MHRGLLESSGAYITIETAPSPNGHISGQMIVPEPSSLVIGGLGAVTLLVYGARLRSRPTRRKGTNPRKRHLSRPIS